MTTSKLKCTLFNAHDLYIMQRMSAIEYFPDVCEGLEADEILSIFMRKHLGVQFTVEDLESERGLVFSGESYEMYKDKKYDDGKLAYGNERSPVWYMLKIMQFHKQDIRFLKQDLNNMRIWLEDNEYMKNKRPTDKFLRERYLVVTTANKE